MTKALLELEYVTDVLVRIYDVHDLRPAEQGITEWNGYTRMQSAKPLRRNSRVQHTQIHARTTAVPVVVAPLHVYAEPPMHGWMKLCKHHSTNNTFGAGTT